MRADDMIEVAGVHVISGCGPGIARPADTPMHGARSVPGDRAYYLCLLNVAMNDVDHLWAHIDDGPSDLAGLASALQRAADLAMRLAK